METAFLALFFLLFAFATADTLLDTDGEPVRNNGGLYYIIPAFSRNGGGLALTRVGREICPRTVIQASSEVSYGLPVRFSSPLMIAILTTCMNVNIEFTGAPPCTPKRPLWHIPQDSELKGSAKIGTDARLQGEFQIRRVSADAYKLMYCPLFAAPCRDLGIVFDEERNRRLVVRDGNPLLVRFKKAAQNPEKWSIV
ncbi:hypothetical protein L6164_008191 [Bauhinia variegata]|uniref:Uncharacterized protein n=1 Tax=Bauhinia variegata TaxID=167791 RepID=A0ACB9PLH0_BAUVA|nr:hypothetical protein L6164_008191 [Bauhinia variegata]